MPTPSTPPATASARGLVTSKLERVVVAVDDLSAAIGDYEQLLGRVASPDGLFGLRNTTLQLVSRSDTEIAGETPGRVGVAGLVFQQDGREASEWLSLAETRRIPIALGRDDMDPSEPAPLLEGVPPDAACAALDHVVVSSADLGAALGLYGDRLGLRLALDRSFEKRGLRILFFRVGGTTVEVVGALAQSAEPEGGRGAFASDGDRFGGLAWEVDDVSAVRGRLQEAGFEVSDERVGHKPGTRVCTVKSRTHGVPTLLKGPDRG